MLSRYILRSHASWLNQVEIYFSVLQRKVLSFPNDFENLEELKNTIFNFQAEYEKVSRPFEWKFTRKELKNLLSKLEDKEKLAACQIRHRIFAPEYLAPREHGGKAEYNKKF